MAIDCDILVMGAGPGGSAVAAILARAGMQVIVLEGEKHPRHHIGESLLPGSIPILNRLGVSSEELAMRFLPKVGARFYDPAGDRLATFGFEATAGSVSPAFQVVREEFDALLAERARAAGAELREDTMIEEIDETAATPGVLLADGSRLTARFLVDASGRAALIAAKRKTRTMIRDYGRVGIYNYFDQLPPHDGDDARYITMYMFDGGWVWLIPLRGGRTSIGVVYRDVPPVNSADDKRTDALFWHAVERMPRLNARLRAARAMEDYRAISDYSFTVGEGGEGKFGKGPEMWAAVGDAGGFLDPIFSSGVHLALSSAEAAAVGILDKLKTGADDALAAYARHSATGFGVFRAFVHRFYNRDLVFNLFFAPNKPPEIHRAITRILAGHVWERDNPVLKMLGIGGDGPAAGPAIKE